VVLDRNNTSEAGNSLRISVPSHSHPFLVIMATPVLHYFDLFARAEVLRLLFIHSKTAFTDHRIQFEEWAGLKASHFAEFDQLPRLDIDGLELVQSRATERYLGAKLGYYPTDPVLIYQVDSIMDLKEDFYMSQFPFVRSKDVEGLAKWYADNAPRFLRYLTLRLASNASQSGWFVGTSVTVADLEVFELLWDYFQRPARVQFEHYLEGCPELKAFREKMLESSAELREYYAARQDKWF